MNNEKDNFDLYLNKYNDQYMQIKDALDLVESSDSETTDISHFRVVNSRNPYPQVNRKEELDK